MAAKDTAAEYDRYRQLLADTEAQFAGLTSDPNVSEICFNFSHLNYCVLLNAFEICELLVVTLIFILIVRYKN